MCGELDEAAQDPLGALLDVDLVEALGLVICPTFILHSSTKRDPEVPCPEQAGQDSHLDGAVKFFARQLDMAHHVVLLQFDRNLGILLLFNLGRRHHLLLLTVLQLQLNRPNLLMLALIFAVLLVQFFIITMVLKAHQLFDFGVNAILHALVLQLLPALSSIKQLLLQIVRA